MTRTRLARALVGISILCPAAGCAVRFELDYDYGMKLAQQQKKLLLLYFKDWSSPEHRNIVHELFSHPAVARELRETVNVELLYNWGDPAKLYRVENQPQVCVLCLPDGHEVDRLVIRNPIPSPEKFADWLRRAKAAARPTPSTQPGK